MVPDNLNQNTKIGALVAALGGLASGHAGVMSAVLVLVGLVLVLTSIVESRLDAVVNLIKDNRDLMRCVLSPCCVFTHVLKTHFAFKHAPNWGSFFLGFVFVCILHIAYAQKL
jgi:hypothetical protein